MTTLPRKHPYTANFEPSVYQIGEIWRVKWRSFDTQKQDAEFKAEKAAKAFADRLRRNKSKLDENEGDNFDEYDKFWRELYQPPIYCCVCAKDMPVKLVDGTVVYPHRDDLHNLPFWKCTGCGNTVGCHHKTPNWSKPLGNIPGEQIKRARQHIHKLLDPLWLSGRFKRAQLYAILSEKLGYQYHTAEITSIEQARNVYKIVYKLANNTKEKPNA